MSPGPGKFNLPVSMLTWDVIVLSGYLLLKITINVYSPNMRDARGQRTIESKDALAFGEDS